MHLFAHADENLKHEDMRDEPETLPHKADNMKHDMPTSHQRRASWLFKKA